MSEKRGRPTVPDAERHENAYRIRLNDADSAIIRAIAKKKGVPPAVVLRALIKDKLPSLVKGGANIWTVSEPAD